MADNNNNNGNPIINSNQNTNSNANLATVLAQLNTTLQGMQNRSNNNSNDNLSQEVQRVLKLLERDSKELNASLSNIERTNKKQEKDNLKSLNDIRKAAELGNTDYQKFLDKFKDQIAKYEELVKKQTELKTKKESAEKEKSSLESEIRGLRAAIDNTQSEDEKEKLRDSLTELTTKLDAAKDAFNEASEELQHTNNQLNQDDMKGISNAATAIANNTQTTTEATRQLNKDQEQRERKNRETNIKIGDSVSKVFDGGLFDLGKNLSGELRNIKEQSLQNLSNSGPLGKLISFGLKTAFSFNDMWIDALKTGVQDLQSSFESTGIDISRAILLNKDEVAEMYGSWAEELKAQGYNVAMTATEAATLANSFANAGINDPELLKEITIEAMKSAALTGNAVTDFTDKEGLTNLVTGLRSGEISSVKDFFETFTNKIVGGIEASGGLAFSQGQTQDMFLNFSNDILSMGMDWAEERLTGSVALKGAGSELGITGITNTFEGLIRDTLEKGINADSTIAAISNTVFSGDIRNASSMEVYAAMAKVLENYESLEGTTLDALISDLGISADDFRTLLRQGGIETLLQEIAKNYETVNNSIEAVESRKNLIQSGGTTTTEQQIKNKAQAEVANKWITAEQSHIPQAANLLADTIEAQGEALEAIIAWGVDSLMSVFLNSAAFQGLGSLGGTGMGKVGAAATAFAAGWGVGTWLDKTFDISNHWSERWSGGTVSEDVKLANKTYHLWNDIYIANEERYKDENEAFTKIIENTTTISDNVQSQLDIALAKENESDATALALGKEIQKKLRQDENASYIYTTPSGEQVAINYEDAQYLTDTQLAYLGHSYASDTSHMVTSYEMDEEGNLVDFERIKDQKWYDVANELSEKEQRTSKEAKGQFLGDATGRAFEYVYNPKYFGTAYTFDEEEYNNYLRQIADSYGYTIDELNDFADEHDFRQRVEKFIEYYNLANIFLNELLPILESEGKDAYIAARKDKITDEDPEVKAWAALVGDYIPQEGIDYEFDANGNAILKVADDVGILQKYDPKHNTARFATGIEYIPYDNYPAYLHKGERVQTAAEVKLDNLIEEVRYTLDCGNNTYLSNDNLEQLNTTNSSIIDGFDTSNDNQTTIIAALQVIIQALTKPGSNYGTTFEELRNDKIAQRNSNMALISSLFPST